MLSRRWIINYFLIVLIIIFTYIGNKYNVQTGYQEDRSISNIKPAQVQSLSIQTADGSFELRRESDRWFVVEPVTWPANNINIERILSLTETETDSRLAASEIDLNELGLQFPRAVLQIDDTRVLFGDTNNIGARRYVLINDEVFLIPDAHLAFISGGLAGFADRRLLPSAVSFNVLTLPNQQLKRQDNGSWSTDKGSDASPDQLNLLINNWQTLQANRVQVMDKNLAPRDRIIANSAEGKTFEFFLLSIEPDIIIANPSLDLQYHFDASQYYGLLEVSKDN